MELTRFPKERQNNREHTEIEVSARFVRIPKEGYLQQCLGLPLSDTSLTSVINRYYLAHKPADSNYLDHAQKATQFLQDQIEEASTSSVRFQGLLETYSIFSAYEKVSFDPELGPMAPIPSVLNDKNSRRVGTLNAISNQLILLASSLNKEEMATNIPQPTNTLKTYSDVMLPPLQERIEHTRLLTLETLSTKDLRSAISTLYYMTHAWLWDKGNQSRTMNYFNVLLEKIGYQPISHGVMDFAAFAMSDFEDFYRYTLFVIHDVEGQQL